MFCFIMIGWGNGHLLVSLKNVLGAVKKKKSSVLQDQESRDEHTQHIGLGGSETTL